MALRVAFDIFSGRPNPVVELEGDEAAAALARLRPERRLRAEEAAAPEFLLGYRGLVIEQAGEEREKDLPQVVRLPDGRHWDACGGAVTLTSDEGAESRADAGRAFEKRVLATAPAGLLPPLPELR